jgi:hypothetical protein
MMIPFSGKLLGTNMFCGAKIVGFPHFAALVLLVYTFVPLALFFAVIVLPFAAAAKCVEGLRSDDR